MAKIVSTKFGDRRLVYLPPINLNENQTPNVETIARPRRPPDRYGTAVGPVSIVPTYPYNERNTQSNWRKNAWLGAPVRSTSEGNIVTEPHKPVGDQIFDQLYQQASTNTIQNYNQGQYPVLPPLGGAAQNMQYTNNGQQTMAQQPSGNTQAAQTTNSTVPVQPQPAQGACPQDKHIYYGPNGEVIRGPPNRCQMNHRGIPIPQDFAIEGILRHGRLITMNLIECLSGFPQIPDFLTTELIEKYGQFEHTVVRIVVNRGQCYVHAIPQVTDSPRYQPGQPEYVPVYLEEDEEFDYEQFVSNYQSGRYPNANPFYRQQPARGYRTQPDGRDFVYKTRDKEIPHPSRPNTYDPIATLRWHKNDARYSVATRHDRRHKTEGWRTAPTRDDMTYIFDGRSTVLSRDDIRPVESLRKKPYRNNNF